MTETNQDLITKLREQIDLRNKRIEQLENLNGILARRCDTLDRENERLKQHIRNIEAEQAA
jgi:hypothetical protein